METSKTELNTAATARNLMQELDRCAGQASASHLVNCFNFTLAFDAYVEIINAMCKVDLVAMEGELVKLTKKGTELLRRHKNEEKAPTHWTAGLEEGKRDAVMFIRDLINKAGNAEVARTAVLSYCDHVLKTN